MAERRADPTNPPGSKKTYSRQQFLDFYGSQHGAVMWRRAGRAQRKSGQGAAKVQTVGCQESVAACCAAPLRSEDGTVVRPITPDDLNAAAKICSTAFDTFNETIGIPPEFPSVEVVAGLLGQGHQQGGFDGFVAVDGSGAVIGSNVLEWRDDIAGIGPISVDTQRANKGAGRMLMQAVMQAAAKRGKKSVRLHQIAGNTKSFSLYLDCGFASLGTYGHYEGVCNAPMPKGFTFAALAAEHVDRCDALHFRVCGGHRRNDITAMINGPAPASVVFDGDGQLVAYTTGCFLSGHSVAATPAALKALAVHVSQRQEEARATGALLPPCTFHLPHSNSDIMRWAKRSGFRLIRQVVQMGYGPYIPPSNGIYCPAIQY